MEYTLGTRVYGVHTPEGHKHTLYVNGSINIINLWMCGIHPMAINIYMLYTLIIVLGKLLCIVMIRKISVFLLVYLICRFCFWNNLSKRKATFGFSMKQLSMELLKPRQFCKFLALFGPVNFYVVLLKNLIIQFCFIHFRHEGTWVIPSSAFHGVQFEFFGE